MIKKKQAELAIIGLDTLACLLPWSLEKRKVIGFDIEKKNKPIKF